MLNKMKMRKNRHIDIENDKNGHEWRLKQAKLNFIDSFMPDGLKIKNNPYALLKYISNKYK
jgi:hypothetical protein